MDPLRQRGPSDLDEGLVGGGDDGSELAAEHRFGIGQSAGRRYRTASATLGFSRAGTKPAESNVGPLSVQTLQYATHGTRRRAACHAHLRRYFHEALPTAPVAQEMLDLVAELY
ncbi:MAG: IS66 family transposase, partial [Polyangiaceae bacterium]